MNEESSKLFLRRWDITEDFINAKLLDLAGKDETGLENFVQQEVNALEKIRNLYKANKAQGYKNRDETRECQPVVQLFLS
jgi:hypothetical protein